jgi:hypothetical protein
MDELDLRLRGRLEALAAAVPMGGTPAPEPRAVPVHRPSPGLREFAALLAILGVISFASLLFTGGSISGVLGPIGGRIEIPEGSIYLALPKDGDIACPGSGDEPCLVSPVPTIDPATAAEGVALRVPSLAVRVDHAGAYSVLVGTAALPNGVLTQADATLLDDVRPELRLRRDLVRLVILGEDGKARGNMWTDGWHPGLEHVEVRLEFQVASLDQPTTLEFTDIVVR